MKLLGAVAVGALVMGLPACRNTTSPLVVGTGTVHPSYAECSAWFIRADPGGEYQLTSLVPELRQGGLRVRFTLRKRTDLASACMVGYMADVVAMTKL